MTTSTEHMEKATHGLMQMYEEANQIAREGWDASLKSAEVLKKGLDEASKSGSNLVQENMMRAVSASKVMMGAKNPREFFDMHNELVKDLFDNWLSGTGRISEISARTTKDAIEPVAQHANSAMTRMAQKTRATA